MRPAENIEKLIKNLSDKTCTKMDERVRKNMLIAMAESEKPLAIPWPNIRKIIMKNPITKLAAAAVIIVAVMLSINIWDKTTSTAMPLKIQSRQVTAFVICVLKVSRKAWKSQKSSGLNLTNKAESRISGPICRNGIHLLMEQK